MTTVKEINHDSGGSVSTHWDQSVTDTAGRLSITVGSALNSSAYGLNINFDDTSALAHAKADITAPGSNELRMRVRLKASSLTIPNNTANILAWALNDSAVYGDLFSVVISGDGTGGLQLAFNWDPGGNYAISSTVEVCIEVAIVRETTTSSADGEARLFINGSQEFEILTLENNEAFAAIDTIRCFAHANPAGSWSGDLFFDEIIIDNSNTADLGCSTAGNAFRFLGFATDNEKLYVSGLKDDTLKLYDYDLTTLAESGTTSFGSATDSEIDNQTRGIKPVIRPATDQVLYLYGRDGNNKQVQYNDLNGTAGWTNIGPGTATWGADKFAVGLMPAPTRPNDVIVVFRDDDTYRTLFGTSNWSKMGDATSGARVAGRDPLDLSKILAGGTVAGTVHYSQNLGVSWGDAGGTAMGTINNFEWTL